MTKDWIKAATIADFAEKSGLDLKLKGKPVALFKTDEGYFAIENACYHQGAPIHDGFVQDCVVTCPWHSWKFNLKNGECTRDDSLIMRTYKVKVEDQDIFVWM
jgi:NAD(P)H-dependent nitrite reductase small subunit